MRLDKPKYSLQFAVDVSPLCLVYKAAVQGPQAVAGRNATLPQFDGNRPKGSIMTEFAASSRLATKTEERLLRSVRASRSPIPNRLCGQINTAKTQVRNYTPRRHVTSANFSEEYRAA